MSTQIPKYVYWTTTIRVHSLKFQGLYLTKNASKLNIFLVHIRKGFFRTNFFIWPFTVLHLLSSHLTHFWKKWDWQDRSLNQSEDSNCQILCQILFLSESSLSSPKLYQMAEPCSNLAQTLLKPRSNLSQTLLKPCSNLAQSSLKPCSNLAQTFFKSHSNLVQISFKPRSDLVQT